MIASLERLVSSAPDPHSARNLVREYLQARILEALQRSGAMVSLAFHGGTALRFLYSLPRFSEDLDFTLERQPERFDLARHAAEAARVIGAEGEAPRVATGRRGAVQRARLSFPGLLHQLGLSHRPEQALMISVEVDTKPPAGVILETSLVRRHVLLNLYHHDRSSLLAGKLHAVLQRAYVKGRDVYDLLWYLADRTWPEPNLVLLNNALVQTGWAGPVLGESSWRTVVAERLRAMQWDRVVADVRPFLEHQGDADLLTEEHLLALVERPS